MQNSPLGASSKALFQIEVQGQTPFQAAADQTLLQAMEQTRSEAIEVGCRGGGCGVCRVQVLAGDYRSKKMSRAHIQPEDEAAGVVLACRIFANSDLQILPLPPIKAGAKSHA